MPAPGDPRLSPVGLARPRTPGDSEPGPGPAAETPDLQGAYPRLTDAQIAALTALGRCAPARPGQVLFGEGDRNCDFFAVLAGHVAVVDGYGTPHERTIGVHGRGRFLGELNLLTGEASYYTAVAADAAGVLAVPVDRLRGLIARDATLGDLILRACLVRRSILIGLGVGLRIVGSRYSPGARRLRDFAARNRIPSRWLDLEADPGAEALLTRLGVAPQDTPIVIVHGRLLRNPGNAELAAAIGLPVPAAAHTSCDLLVAGAGPAGLSAAVYGASEGLRTTVLDSTATGGQAGTSSRIENYLGFPSGISGAELAGRAVLQAQKFGARFAVPAQAASIAQDGAQYTIQLDDGTSVTGLSVVIATGARYRRLSVPRLEFFEQMSVYYAASQAEALVCRGEPVVIVGGGNAAGQAAVFLARHAAQVTLVVRERDLGEYMSRYLTDQVTRIANVHVLLGTEVRELLGDQALEAVAVADGQTGARRVIRARAMFVFVGVTPCTGWLGGLVELDDHGFVRTGYDAAPPADTADGAEAGWRRAGLETSRVGIFAAGDVRSGSAKRVAAAVGEGAMAVRFAFERVRPS
ncbi:MAG TPA: FAD-dependent oxidoreductase [Streptosporangiaceae bacterium]|nr:FAD-dependent oxidoreductase [Streptosporangiaceae bacterium]